MKFNPLYRSIETASNFTDRVLVSFSGGKDSVVTLDLCMKYFKEVQGFFMYQVANMSFQESIIRYYEDKYSIPIHRIPHFELSDFFRYGLYRRWDTSVPIIGVYDVYCYIREMTDIHWIAAGERINDSLWRRGMIKSMGTIVPIRGRFFPVAEWRKQDIMAYVKQHKLRIGAESAVLGFSFASFAGKELYKIRKHFPQDYEKIKEWFPFVEASIINAKMRGFIKDESEQV